MRAEPCANSHANVFADPNTTAVLKIEIFDLKTYLCGHNFVLLFVGSDTDLKEGGGAWGHTGLYRFI